MFLVLLLLCLIVMAGLLLSGRLHVAEGTYVIVERLGKFHKVLPAGNYLLLPVIDKAAYQLSAAAEKGDVPGSSSDGNR